MSKNQIMKNEDLELLLDNHLDPMAISDLEGVILAINNKLAAILGKKKEQLIGTSSFDYVEQDVGKHREKIIKKAIKLKKPVVDIDTNRGRWWKTIYQPILDDKRTVVKLAYYIQEITGEKDTELKLKKKENELEDTLLKLKTITENINVGLYYTDANGNFLWANKKAADIVGKTRNEMIGKNGKYLLDMKAISKKDYLKALKLLTLVKLGKKAGPEVFDITQNDGIKKNIEIQAQRIVLHDGAVVVGIVNDITNRKKSELKREESEAKFQILSDQSLMGLGIVQGDEIKYTNDAITEITGYSKDEVLSEGTKLLSRMIHPEDLSFVSKQLQKKLAGDKDVIDRYSCRIITKTGKIKWLEIFSKTIQYEGKNADYITFVDISKIKDAEVSIRKSEEKYRQLVKNIDEGLFSIDKTGKFFYANKVALRGTGFSKREFYKLNYLDIVSPEYHEIAQKKFEQIIKGEKITPFEIKYFTQNGKKLYIEIKGQPIYRNKEIAGVQCLSIDITERKKHEQILKESEQKFRALAEQSPNMIFINKKGKIVYANKKSSDIMGYTNDELCANDFDFFTLIAPESHNLIKDAFSKHMDGKDVPGYEYALLTKDGVRLNALITTKIINYEGAPSILGTVTDITKMKITERKIKATKDYLQNVIDSTTDLIISFDRDLNITTWNKPAERLTGWKKNKLLGKNPFNENIFYDDTKVINYLKNIFNGNNPKINEIVLRDKTGEKHHIKIATNVIENEIDSIIGILLVGRDITSEIRKYSNIIQGNGYLLTDKNQMSISDLMDTLKHKKKTVLIFSRGKKIEYEKFMNYIDIKNLEDLISKIEKFLINKRGTVVLLDRVDYLITKYSFGKFMETIYRLNDIIEEHKSNLIMRINPDYLEKKQYTLLQEEFKILPTKTSIDIALDGNLLSILKYIYERNQLNETVTYTKIYKNLSISRVTNSKRVEELKRNDLVHIEKIGKSKYVTITEKGKNIIEKN